MKNKKKHIIHLLAVGAMALSWIAIGNVHNHLHPPPVKLAKKNNKRGRSPKEKRELATAQEPITLAENAKVETPKVTPAEAKVVPKAPSAQPQPQQQQQPKQKPTAAPAPAETQTPVNQKDMSIDKTKIDSNFIRLVEGSMAHGYVPLAKTTKSGVTVGNGVDLGQMNKNELQKLPVENSLKDKLFSYIGLKKQKAVAFLKAHPLSLNSDELSQLDKVAGNRILQPLAAEYYKMTGKMFTQLPSQAQTVVFSIAYQYGPGFTKNKDFKQFWSYFTSGNWAKASQALKNIKQYSTRRHQEARLLDQIA